MIVLHFATIAIAACEFELSQNAMISKLIELSESARIDGLTESYFSRNNAQTKHKQETFSKLLKDCHEFVPQCPNSNRHQNTALDFCQKIASNIQEISWLKLVLNYPKFQSKQVLITLLNNELQYKGFNFQASTGTISSQYLSAIGPYLQNYFFQMSDFPYSAQTYFKVGVDEIFDYLRNHKESNVGYCRVVVFFLILDKSLHSVEFWSNLWSYLYLCNNHHVHLENFIAENSEAFDRYLVNGRYSNKPTYDMRIYAVYYRCLDDSRCGLEEYEFSKKDWIYLLSLYVVNESYFTVGIRNTLTLDDLATNIESIHLLRYITPDFSNSQLEYQRSGEDEYCFSRNMEVIFRFQKVKWYREMKKKVLKAIADKDQFGANNIELIINIYKHIDKVIVLSPEETYKIKSELTELEYIKGE
eukprot:NODE_421_length_8910_cov_0.283623.p1 type:complete len:416 gc:universal NODE_421_length_8910_cov_0.283623:3047-4294(+)